jgi:hypothetical protein
MVNRNFNVLGMALKTFRFVQGLSKTFFVSPPSVYHRTCQNYVANKTKNRASGQFKIWKSENPGSLTSAQGIPQAGGEP